MKRLLALALVLLCLIPHALAAGPAVSAKAAILMEKESGAILHEADAHTPLEPASVTKVMTLLLIMEALDEGRITPEEMVTVSANAAGMGGSQVYLKEGEQMCVSDMLKAICVASGNDASVAMAEHLSGSEEAFVAAMNQRAAELGMQDTRFCNCTGLPAEGHVTSAHDIALMSRELVLHHPGIRAYTTIWMDTLRGGTFQLANTNKLIYYYQGATGLKTGSTDAALYCLSATAERDGMELIAVILGSPTSADRFEGAKALLNYGFSTYTLLDVTQAQALPPVAVALGEQAWVQPQLAGTGSRLLVEKAKLDQVSTAVELADSVTAPVEAGQLLGKLVVTMEGQTTQEIPLVAAQSVARLTAGQIFQRLLATLFLNG